MRRKYERRTRGLVNREKKERNDEQVGTNTKTTKNVEQRTE